MPPDDQEAIASARSAAAKDLLAHLRESVKRRVMYHTCIGILFSGGLDSMILAALAGEFCDEIDLINVCFGNGQSPDRKTAFQGEVRSIV